MKNQVLILLLLLTSAVGYNQEQDSTQLKVTYSHKINDTTINYIFKLPSGEKVKSVCYCKEQRKKGETVTVAKKDIEFIKPSW